MMILFALLVIIGSASALPRQKRFDAFDPYPESYAYAGPHYGGAYAGAGAGFFPYFGFNPFYSRGGFWMPFLPVPATIPWYKGPNVCETKKVFREPEELTKFLGEDSSSFEFQHESETCRGDNKKYICYGKELTNQGSRMFARKLECCYGFERPLDGSPGCVEIDLRYLIPTLRNMGASEFVSIIDKVSMSDSFHSNNYTVFCPPSAALEAFRQDVDNNIDNDLQIKLTLQKLKRKTNLYDLLTSHISSGFFKIDDMKDEDILQTENPKCNIRINVYFTPEKVVTANCIPVLSGDHFARNGIVHVIKKLIPTASKTVADIIAGDAQFSILKGMLSIAGLVQTLRNPNGSFTMFAPTDSAFSTGLLPQNAGNSNRCTVSVMKHHIIDHVICSAALPQHARSLNMIGELLSLTRDQNNKLYVDGVQIVVRDLLATNGVVHIIDGILSTRQTKTISQVLEESGLHEFLSLIESANLKEEFDTLENVTFFVPTDEVMQRIPSKNLKSFLSHNESVLDVLRFHVVDGQVELNAPDQVLNSRLDNATVRLQVHITYPQMTPQVLVQCASVLSANIKLCGGTLHVINKPLVPPKITIIDFLESIDGFSTLVLLLRATGLDRRLRSKMSTHTLLAPTDDAFHQMGDQALFRILENIDKATDLIKMHILLGSVCCNELKNDFLSGRRQTRTMDGSLLSLERSSDGILMVGGAHIVDCDIMATNGVVHMTDAVISHDSTFFLGGGYLDNVFIIV